jgi:hypothetical protein
MPQGVKKEELKMSGKRQQQQETKNDSVFMT